MTGLGTSLAAVGHTTLLLSGRGPVRRIDEGPRFVDGQRPLIMLTPTGGADTWPKSLDPTLDEIASPLPPRGVGRRRARRLADIAYTPAWELPDPDAVRAGTSAEPNPAAEAGPRLYRRAYEALTASLPPNGAKAVAPVTEPEQSAEPEDARSDLLSALMRETAEELEPVDPAERQALLRDLRFLDDW